MTLLQPGNTKLGPAIFHWSIPAGETCPGQTPACAAQCYAKRGNHMFPDVQKALRRRLALTRRADFTRLMVAEIKQLWPRVVRIHVAGDFYSAAYTRKWADVARQCPDVRFYAYTRSWRVPSIARELRALAQLPNVRLWYSVDKDSEQPRRLPYRVKVAYMQTAHQDLPRKADLLFRVQRLRKTVQKLVSLPLADALTCPVENGATGHATNCQKCKVCWR